MSKLDWQVVEHLNLDEKRRKRHSVLVQCKCGYVRIMRIADWNRLIIKGPNSHTSNQCRKCGLLKKTEEERDLAAFKHLYNNLIASSKRVGRIVELSLEQATSLYKSNCYYCNRTPSNLYKSTTRTKHQVSYTGIDRKDSARGYELNNVVPCCYSCNRAKMDLSQDEFYKLVSDIYCFRVQRLSRRGVGSSDPKLETPSASEGWRYSLASHESVSSPPKGRTKSNELSGI